MLFALIHDDVHVLVEGLEVANELAVVLQDALYLAADEAVQPDRLRGRHEEPSDACCY